VPAAGACVCGAGRPGGSPWVRGRCGPQCKPCLPACNTRRQAAAAVRSVAAAEATACGGTMGRVRLSPRRPLPGGRPQALPPGGQGRLGQPVRLLRPVATEPEPDPGSRQAQIQGRQHFALQPGAGLSALQCRQGQHGLLAQLVPRHGVVLRRPRGKNRGLAAAIDGGIADGGHGGRQ